MPIKKKGPTLEETTRAKIAKYLPEAIDSALQSYRHFYGQSDTTDTKAFSAHHAACKTAIAHIDLLLKLAVWAQFPREADDADLTLLMADAQAELNRYQEDDNA